mmetsp:Transcript_13168/g.23424  ORF Transcript_13168/g.23424 Transcript_13168/m.23424 type:complete len:212 (-) Transcript_13168:116-751(-)
MEGPRLAHVAKILFLSQFIFHCCYFTLTVLAFWHSEKVSWCTGVLGLMTLGYGVEEIYQLLSENGFERYINDPWNVIDAAFLFSFLLWYATEIDVWLAVNLFLAPFRLLHYLSIFQSAGVLVAVLIHMITATCNFLVFYAVILFGFSAMMLALFGNKGLMGLSHFHHLLSLFLMQALETMISLSFGSRTRGTLGAVWHHWSFSWCFLLSWL